MPFVTLLLAGAMASLDRATIEAGRNLGASRLRVLVELVLPQVAQTLLVGLVLSFVTMLSVLSVPMMVAGSQPTMLTVDMAFRINAYGDYATANALGVISYVITRRWPAISTCGTAWRSESRAMSRVDVPGCVPRWRALVLGRLRLRAVRAARQPGAVVGRRALVHALQAAGHLRHRYWEVVFRPTGDAMASLGTSVCIAC